MNRGLTHSDDLPRSVLELIGPQPFSSAKGASFDQATGLPEGWRLPTGAPAEGVIGPYRATPLLRLVPPTVDGSDKRLLVVGRWHMWVGESQDFALAEIEGVWRESDGWAPVDDLPQAIADLEGRLFLCTPDAPRAAGQDRQHAVTVWAKAEAEASRNTVAYLRRIRHGIEKTFSDELRAATKRTVTTTMATLVDLKVALGRARDQGLGLYRAQFNLTDSPKRPHALGDNEAYHSYRRALDPTLINPHEPATVNTRSWMRTHDAAMRQTRALHEELREEIANLSDLVSSATGVFQARDAQAQESFNIWAAVAAMAIGLPSLVLAYYGADRLPLKWSYDRWQPLFPVFLTAASVAGYILWVMRSRSLGARLWAAVVVIVGVMLPVVIAGLMQGR